MAQKLVLKLFIVGGRPESALAVGRLLQILQDLGLNAGSVRIVDLQQEPQLAKEAQVVGVPMLVKESPPPRKVIVGDLSNTSVVLDALGRPSETSYTSSGAATPREADRGDSKTVLRPRDQIGHLTAREVEVMALLGNGDSNRQIGEVLGITVDTVKKHIGHVMKKLGAHSRTEAAIIYRSRAPE